MNIEIWSEVDKRIQKPIEACQFISDLMKSCKDKTFNRLITSDFTNTTNQIQNSIATFHSECSKLFDIKAIYLEMNGFDINPDRWFFDFFGYDKLSKIDDSLDWLADWKSPDYPELTLTGLESIQELYSSYMNKEQYKDENKEYNQELATLLVMAKFCKLIAKSIDGLDLGIPVYATAHDFDIVFCKNL